MPTRCLPDASQLSLPYFTLPYLTLLYLTLPYLTLSYFTLPFTPYLPPYLTLYLTLPYLALSCLAIPYLTLPYLTLLYLFFFSLMPLGLPWPPAQRPSRDLPEPPPGRPRITVWGLALVSSGLFRVGLESFGAALGAL